MAACNICGEECGHMQRHFACGDLLRRGMTEDEARMKIRDADLLAARLLPAMKRAAAFGGFIGALALIGAAIVVGIIHALLP